MSVPRQNEHPHRQPAGRTAAGLLPGRAGIRHRTGILLLLAGLGVVLPQLPVQAELLSPRTGSLPGPLGGDMTAPRDPAIDLKVQSPRRTPIPRAADDLEFEIRKIRISGATVYSDADLQALAAPLLNRKARLADLLALAEQIEARYRADGYALTRAVVPTQSVSDGIFEISILEGYVSAVTIEGQDAGLRSRVEAMMRKVTASRPLKLAVLENALLRANEIPGAKVAGLLRPSDSEPKASELVVTVDAKAWETTLTFDNAGGRNTGVWTIGANLAVRSPLNEGGEIILGFAAAPDVNERRVAQAKYLAPVGRSGAVFSFGATASHGEPVGSVKDLDVVSNSTSFGPRLSWPAYVDRTQKLSIDSGFTFQSADMKMRTFDLTLHDNWRVGDLGVNYQNKALLMGTLDASIVLAKGFSIIAPTWRDNPSQTRAGSDPDFTKVTATLRRVQTLRGPLTLQASAQAQHAWNVLLPGEEISFGGSSLGRGYEPAALTGDDGVGGALEIRYDWTDPVWGLDWLQAYAFTDVARSFSRDQGTMGRHSLSSAGVGLRSVSFQRLSLGLMVARTLAPVTGSDKGKRATKVLVDGAVKY